MAKRFIDTNIFSDEWFFELSKEGKLFFIYYITNCDHAGILRLNQKLAEFQTGIKSLVTVIKEFGNCLVTVREHLYFMPKFIKFQYPEFPQSNVKQQDGAVKILKELNLWDDKINSYVRVTQELPNSYDNDNVIVNDNVKEEQNENFQKFNSWVKENTPQILKLKTQITIDNFIKLKQKYSTEQIQCVLIAMGNKKDLEKKYDSVYLTCLNWLKNAR